jgi:hypothetical protein
MVQTRRQRTARIFAPASVATTNSPARKRARDSAAVVRTRRLSDPLVGEPGARDPQGMPCRGVRATVARSPQPPRRCLLQPEGPIRPRAAFARPARTRKGGHSPRPAQSARRRSDRTSAAQPRARPQPMGRRLRSPGHGRGSRTRGAWSSQMPSPLRAGGIRRSRRGRSRCPMERWRPEGSRTDDSGRCDPRVAPPASRRG